MMSFRFFMVDALTCDNWNSILFAICIRALSLFPLLSGMFSCLFHVPGQ